MEVALDVIVTKGWNSGVPDDLILKLSNFSSYMHSWGKQVKLAFKSHIDLCCKEVESLIESSNEGFANKFSIAKEKLNNLIAQEESYSHC